MGVHSVMNFDHKVIHDVAGEFIDRGNERYYVIHDVDKMVPFFISLVSDSEHWLFISSRGGLTAGRVSPDSALFPYVTDDKIHENSDHTGSKTLLRVHHAKGSDEWEPFNIEHDGRFHVRRKLYKNQLGDKICFEEINHDLKLAFRYTWMTSDEYGFIRDCEIENLGVQSIRVDMIDGLQNILPAGTPRQLQSSSSNLVDAYKWNEVEESSGLAFFTLYSGITDKPEPFESLRANTCFCHGLKNFKVLLSSHQLENFRLGNQLQQVSHTRGVRGAYLVATTLDIAPNASEQWQIVADVEQTQSQVVKLSRLLKSAGVTRQAIHDSVTQGSDNLRRIIAGVDGFQITAEENVFVHHYANVLFNSMRGGIYDDQYRINSQDFITTVRHFNRAVYQRNQACLEALPGKLQYAELLSQVKQQGDRRLEGLCYEYLPITFSRRHGDPSRPWNEFAIRLKDDNGNPLLSYQGNWRDIFQNWEALSLSFPEFIENVIAKFVNASTVDGYNPYRVLKEGIDWEVEDPDDPWSYIGYWGDHQIIYLLKLLELSNSFHPEKLGRLLRHPVFCYANVPYRIRPFDDLVEDSKNTVEYSETLAERIEQRVAQVGADGKLLLNDDGEVYRVNLLEKLLVPLLSKLGNFVPAGGIWLNTQRPEWNDANNALVGQGVSMVTLCYLRRYVQFLRGLLEQEQEAFTLSSEVAIWLRETAGVLTDTRKLLAAGPVDNEQRFDTLRQLGQASSRYRESVYSRESFSGTVSQQPGELQELLDDALSVIDSSIVNNRRDDGLYHAYNLLKLAEESATVDNLYLMLEGQVAVLSSGAITVEQSVHVLKSLFDCQLYRADQHSFLLYPDRQQAGFLGKNRIPETEVAKLPLLQQMLTTGDESIILRDMDGNYRFNPELVNRAELGSRLTAMEMQYGDDVSSAQEALCALYEQVFNHQEFTGRSGGMFGFEGLGCIYWHMVSKLLLAAQEAFFTALDQHAWSADCQKLGELYYRVRAGIGFNKSPMEYGAFPTDPYSHTPGHAGARQPGMTGQVKEEVLTRFGELGIRVSNGIVQFRPNLLRSREFLSEARVFGYLDVSGNWQELMVPGSGLAFTWCQVPIVYVLDDEAESGLIVTWDDGTQEERDTLELSVETSREIFRRSGKVQQLLLKFDSTRLFRDFQ